MDSRTDTEGAGGRADKAGTRSERRTAGAGRVRRGFLPIVTNWFDRLFISVVIWVALSLLWMRFVEHAIPLWVCNVLALALAALIVTRG